MKKNHPLSRVDSLAAAMVAPAGNQKPDNIAHLVAPGIARELLAGTFKGNLNDAAVVKFMPSAAAAWANFPR